MAARILAAIAVSEPCRTPPFAIIAPGTAEDMTDDNIRVWRDEERLPLEELEQAVSGSSLDGQADDVTGNDAGEEATFGHGPAADDRKGQAQGNSREDTDPERRYRPSTTGRTGPDVG